MERTHVRDGARSIRFRYGEVPKQAKCQSSGSSFPRYRSVTVTRTIVPENMVRSFSTVGSFEMGTRRALRNRRDS
jgi:hypothetical protein